MKKILIIGIGLVAGHIGYAQEIPVSVKDSNAIKELFFAGLREKLNDNYTKANANFSKILLIDPENEAVYFELANLYLRQNRLLDAEIAIKKALTINPNNVWFLKLQAQIYKQTGNMPALVQTFDQLILLVPETESYYFDRANALYIGGRKEEALQAYYAMEQKFGVSKASTAAKERLNNSNLTNLPSYNGLQQLITENPNDVKNYLHLSGVLLEQKKTEEALELLLKAKALATDNYEVNLALADIYYALKKPKEASDALKQAFHSTEMPLSHKMKILSQMLIRFNQHDIAKNAVELAEIVLKDYSDDPKVRVLYGDILYQKGALNEARQQYLLAIGQSDQLYIAWEKLLGVQTLMGRYEEAIKTGEEALSLYPNQAILYYYRAFSLHRNGQNAEAGLELKYALQLEADDPNLKSMILALQAEVLIDQGRLKEADKAFDEAVQLAPDNYLTMSNYAYYLALRNQNLVKAEKLAAKAVAAQPHNSSVLDTYAVVLFKLGRYNEALKYIEKVVQNSKDANPVYLEHYGDILFMKGEKENALLQWQNSRATGNHSEKLMRKINEKKYIK